jgi:hypothetical protein
MLEDSEVVAVIKDDRRILVGYLAGRKPPDRGGLAMKYSGEYCRCG